MTRISTAMAATAMALAAAGGGLLLAAASAVPAGASTTGTPAAPHPGHTITIHAHPPAHASRIGPHLQSLPCGSDICNPGSGGPIITCSITANPPEPNTLPGAIVALSTVHCDGSVPKIDLTGTLILNGAPVTSFPGFMQGQTQASAQGGIPCQPGTYTNSGSATITFPPGYVIIEGSNPIHAVSSPFTTTCNNGGGGGGGGGGCAVHAPSLAGHPAGRHPHVISCP